jgi:hypothetical protein
MRNFRCMRRSIWGRTFFSSFFSKHESDFGAAGYRVVLSCFYEKSIQILKKCLKTTVRPEPELSSGCLLYY